MRLDRPQQHLPFQHPSLGQQILHGIPVRDPRHVLLDDGTLVQALRGVMRGGSHQLDAPRVGAVVGLGSDEGGQEAVVDVDGRVSVLAAEFVRDDLHVPREDDEVHSERLHQSDFLVFLLSLVVLGDWEYLVAYAKVSGNVAQLVMIGNYEGDVAGKLAGLVSQQEFPYDVIVLGNEDANLLFGFAPIDGVSHVKAMADFRDAIG
mmetsp:Transcript_21417/g.36798  ORF Transcript_21417/g.36798 Transcript_21417/m.36798 type:complete len:205 (-) Transcript_21417:258-872(-)